MKNPNEQWNSYLSNKNVRPKTFSVTLERDSSGTFRVIGGGAQVLDVKNQYQSEWVGVDARDIAAALRNSNIVAN